MKEIKETRTIEEVKGYEANDGTFFSNKEECEKYEKTAKAVIYNKVKPYRIAETTEYDFFLYRGCDDVTVEIFNIETEKVFDDVCMYIKFHERVNYSGEITLPKAEDFVGKNMIVSWNYDEDWCDIETIDTIIDKQRKVYETLIKANVMPE